MPCWIPQPVSCHTPEAATTVFKCSWRWTQRASETCRVTCSPEAATTVSKCSWRWTQIAYETCRAILQLQINILPSCITLVLFIYRVSQEEWSRLREGVPYVKVYRYSPKHLCPKLNGYRDNGQRKVWSYGGSTHCTCQLTALSMLVVECGVIWRQFSSR